jgi:hypothetical protein
MESLHGLVDGRVGVEAMALEHVDVVELKALQALLHRVEDVL